VAETFDRFDFIEILEKEGIERKHAEAFATAVRKSQEAALEDFAKTAKESSEQVVKDLDSKTEKVLMELNHMIDSGLSAVRSEITIGNKDLLIKLGSIIGAAVVAMRWMPHAARASACFFMA